MVTLDLIKQRTSATVRPEPISVNGVVIASADITREIQNYSATSLAAARLAAARALVVRELLRQEVVRQGISSSPLTDDDGCTETEEEAAMRLLLDRECLVPVATETECRRYYDNNRSRFRSAPLVAARHILLAAAPDDDEARSTARDVANRLVAELTARPDRFADLARAHSACPSAEMGGALGQIGPGQTVPEFEEALFRLEAGSGVSVVETRYGIHIVRLDAVAERQDLPFEVVRDLIGEYLSEQTRQVVHRHYVETLAAAATITGISLQET